MFIKMVDGRVTKVKESENRKTLEVVSYVFPIENAGNNYYDGLVLKRGTKYAKVTKYGGGNGWARRGSMSEYWENELPSISAKEYDARLGWIEAAMKTEDEIDREEEIGLAAHKVLNCVSFLEYD